MKRIRLTAFSFILAAIAGPALACEAPNPLRPEIVAATPVVVRGEITGIEVMGDGTAVITVDVAQTYRGTEAETWTVTWSWESVIVPPGTLEALAAQYGGLDVVLGLTPTLPGIAVDALPARIDAGAGDLAQQNCAVPFLGSYAEMEAVLRERGWIE